ncbi:MAG TPA: hypothetical protein VKA98_03675 [Nitrososphaeraceae archaeon]|nr:hypothetical protein [Nitrososphaeraceae archaeon]
MNQLTKTSDRWYLDNKSDMALSNKTKESMMPQDSLIRNSLKS